MSRFLRKWFARVLVGGACLLPLAIPAEVQAQLRSTEVAPIAKPMTPKELHQHLAHGVGWIRIFEGNTVTSGTGWILDLNKKLMITNNHVVEDRDEVWVTFPMWKGGKLVTAESEYANSPKLKAVVIDRDANRDLALLRVESIPERMHALKLAADEPDEGEEIRTIGSFTTGGDGLVWGAVAGTVRACGPQELGLGKQRRVKPVREVLSDARTNGGNSGAPIVNTAGEVVAVHFAWKYWANNVSRHVSVIELKAYLKESLPLVEPKTAAQFLTRAKRRLNANRPDAAIADASAALAKEPKLVAAMVIRGRAFLAKNQPQTALKDFNGALELDPDNYDILVARGEAHRAAGKSAEAICDFSTAICVDPESFLAYNERGLAHYRAQKYADAETDFGRAIDAAPKIAGLWGNRAEARFMQQKFEQAIPDWVKGTELAPGDPYFPNGLGMAYLKLKKFDAAAEAFASAVKIGDGVPLYTSNLGEALRLGGKHDAAVKAFTATIERRKKLQDSGVTIWPFIAAGDYYSRAQSWLALKRYKDAIEDLTKAIELTDGTAGLIFAERASAFEARGEKDAAEADRKAAEALGFKFEKAAQNPLVGTWTGTYNSGFLKVTEVITFHANGTFDITITQVGPVATNKTTDTGTWSTTKTTLTFNAKKLGKFVRPFELNGDNLDIEVEERGFTIHFTRDK